MASTVPQVFFPMIRRSSLNQQDAYAGVNTGHERARKNKVYGPRHQIPQLSIPRSFNLNLTLQRLTDQYESSFAYYTSAKDGSELWSFRSAKDKNVKC